MLVRNKETNREFNAVKNEDGTYIVDGITYSKEDMTKMFIPIKVKVESKEKVITSEHLIVNGKTEMFGDIGALAEALSKCQGAFESIKKGTEGHGYNYADLSAVLAECSPVTSKHGIAVTQMNLSMVIDDVLMIGVKTILIHKSGGCISSEIYMPTTKTKMNSLVQMAGVSITYLRRYGVQSALGLSTTDNDGSDK